MVRPERFELPTPWFVAKYSIQMSYGRTEGANYSKASDDFRARFLLLLDPRLFHHPYPLLPLLIGPGAEILG